MPGASIGLTLLVPRREKGRRRRDHVCDYAEERMISNPFYIQFQKGSSPDGWHRCPTVGSNSMIPPRELASNIVFPSPLVAHRWHIERLVGKCDARLPEYERVANRVYLH